MQRSGKRSESIFGICIVQIVRNVVFKAYPSKPLIRRTSCRPRMPLSRTSYLPSHSNWDASSGEEKTDKRVNDTIGGMYHFTKIILIRHAQARSPDGKYGPDTPLSPLGLKQAALLTSSFVVERSLAAVYCSPYRRAVQTAEVLSKALNMATRVDPRISEFQVSLAALDDLQRKRTDVILWRPEDQGAPDGESIEEFFQRVYSACDELCDRHPDETIALVTHAGTIDAMFRWAVGIAANRPWTFEVEVGNATISEIEVWPHGRIDGGPPRHAILHQIGNGSHLGSNASGI